MTPEELLQTLQSPSYVVGPDGRPAAALIDLTTWKSIIERLEDQEDSDVLREVAADLKALAGGRLPAGWKPWEEFEGEFAT